MKKNSHCSYCGTQFTEQVAWPRKCFRCYNDSWSNPTPVVVVMLALHTWDKNNIPKYGLIIQQRGIEPKKDHWALTGGYVDHNESWQDAAVREVREELNINIQQPEYLHIYDVTHSTTKDCMLVFCTYDIVMSPGSLGNFKPNDEVLAVDVMYEERELAFPTHTEMANRYLRELQQRMIQPPARPGRVPGR